MAMSPAERDEFLFLSYGRLKSHLESEGVLKDVSEMRDIIHGTNKKAALPLRVDWMEERIKRLVKSNAKLQAAIYIATGMWIMVKFYFEFLAPHK